MSTARFALPLLALFLGCTALGGNAQAGWFDFGSDRAAKLEAQSGTKSDGKTAPKDDAATLDGSIEQARQLRLDGNYAEAVRHLSQLMMIASDDGRVISEYGKTLAAMGRAQDAVNFLTRAQQLSPTDWTIYSALGVAYDQLGNQNDARAAYEQALRVKPGEPSVLNNFALSRMLAKDPEGAKALIARAQLAGGQSDAKIARNIAMIQELAPDTAAKDLAGNAPAPAPVAPVAQQALPRMAAQPAPFVNLPVSPAAPRPLQSANAGVIDAAPQMMAPPRGVVMQRVPNDPQAGPVIAAIPRAATRAPRALAPKTDGKPETKTAPQAVSQAAKAAPSNDLQAKAEALAKQMAGKPQAIAAARTEANKPQVSKPADTKPVPPSAKPTDTKPAPKSLAKAEPAKPAQTADAKAKNAIPGLRLSANAY